MCDPKSLIAPPFLTRTEHICTHHGVVITCGILNGGLLILNERSTELALLMRDTSSMKQRGWPPLERISTFEVMNLDGSEATPGFPGFYVFKSILVCVCVCAFSEWVSPLSVLVFPGPPHAGLIYLSGRRWEYLFAEMQCIIVCHHSTFHFYTRW